MKKLLIAVIALPVLMLFAGCKDSAKEKGSNNIEEVVEFTPSANDILDSDLIESVEFTRLESGDNTLFSDLSEMIVSNDGDIFVIDKQQGRILRFGSEGNYLNDIGSQGRGPNEFIEINYVDFIPESKTLVVYSYHNDAAFNYSADGKLISKDDLPFKAEQIVSDGDSYWYYLGFGNIQRPERVVRTKADHSTEISAYLPSEAKIFPMQERFAAMVPFQNDMYIRETFSNNIHKINDDGVAVAYNVDFGKFNIPGEYFNMNDPFKAFELLSGKRYATINKFDKNEDFTIIQAYINPASENETKIYATAIKDNHTDKWSWFNYDKGKDEDHLFAGELLFLNDSSEIFFLVDPGKAINTKLLDKYPAIKNPDVLREAKSDDNYLVMKSKLRRSS